MHGLWFLFSFSDFQFFFGFVLVFCFSVCQCLCVDHFHKLRIIIEEYLFFVSNSLADGGVLRSIGDMVSSN